MIAAIIAIRDLRRRLGMSQMDLAVTLHVTRPMVQRWEQGRNRPTPSRLAALAQLAAAAGLAGVDVVATPADCVTACGCGVRHAKGVRCPVCLCEYTPSPEEIAEAAAAIQGEWTAAERANRARGMTADELKIPSIAPPARWMGRHAV